MATRTVELGKPVPNIAEVLPDQGAWTERQYLAISARRLVEYTDGVVEILPMPTTSHQEIVFFLVALLRACGQTRHPGRALMAPLKLQIRPRKYREPDVMFALDEHADFIGEPFWIGADLVVEVVSPDDPERDYIDKRSDYAEGKVPEYWIVDPQRKTFAVLTLGGEAYVEHGVYQVGESAASVLLDGVTVDVAAVFAAGRIAE